MGRELRGSTLGLIGYGQIARHLAPVATALGMRVLVSDPYVRVDAPRLEQVEFAALLQAADFVVCLAPATPATANLIDAGAFAAMKPGAYFINVARRTGRRAGAVRGARHRPARGLCARRRARARPDADARARGPSTRDRDAARRRADAARGRAPGARDGRSAAALLAGSVPRRQRGACPAAGALAHGRPIPGRARDETRHPPAADACDCHIHIYDDVSLAPTATFRPPHAPVDAYRAQQTLGLTASRDRAADWLWCRQPLPARRAGRIRPAGARRRDVAGRRVGCRAGAVARGGRARRPVHDVGGWPRAVGRTGAGRRADRAAWLARRRAARRPDAARGPAVAVLATGACRDRSHGQVPDTGRAGRAGVSRCGVCSTAATPG